MKYLFWYWVIGLVNTSVGLLFDEQARNNLRAGWDAAFDAFNPFVALLYFGGMFLIGSFMSPVYTVLVLLAWPFMRK